MKNEGFYSNLLEGSSIPSLQRLDDLIDVDIDKAIGGPLALSLLWADKEGRRDLALADGPQHPAWRWLRDLVFAPALEALGPIPS